MVAAAHRFGEYASIVVPPSIAPLGQLLERGAVVTLSRAARLEAKLWA
jgi:hypothetical protein